MSLSLSLPARSRNQLRRTFDQLLSGLMQGQLPLKPEFWTAIAPALEDGGTPAALLADLGTSGTP